MLFRIYKYKHLLYEANDHVQTDVGECPICLEETDLITCLPCGHKVCQTCLPKALENSMRCVMCRGFVIGASPAMPVNEKFVYSVSFSRDIEMIGITIVQKQIYDAIRVTRVDKGSCAYNAGILSGSKLLSVNGIVCTNKNYVIQQINMSKKIQMTLIYPVRYQKYPWIYSLRRRFLVGT
jgi:hypothetical protein